MPSALVASAATALLSALSRVAEAGALVVYSALQAAWAATAGAALRALYFHGPALGGVGFWQGAADVDACAQMTGTPSTMWRVHGAQGDFVASMDCVLLREQRFLAFVYGVVAAAAVLAASCAVLELLACLRWRVVVQAALRDLSASGFVVRRGADGATEIACGAAASALAADPAPAARTSTRRASRSASRRAVTNALGLALGSRVDTHAQHGTAANSSAFEPCSSALAESDASDAASRARAGGNASAPGASTLRPPSVRVAQNDSPRTRFHRELSALLAGTPRDVVRQALLLSPTNASGSSSSTRRLTRRSSSAARIAESER